MSWFSKLTSSFAVLCLASACVQKQSQSIPDNRVRGGPLLKDHKIDLSSADRGANEAFADSATVLDSSEILHLAQDLVALGDASGHRSLQVQGRSLIKSFYSQANLTTVMTPEQSPYLEAALGEKWTVLQKLLQEERDGIDRSIIAVKEVSKTINFTIIPTPDLSLTSILEQVIHFLVGLGDAFQAHGATSDVVLSYEETVRSTYLPKLQKLERELSPLDQGQGLDQTLKILNAVLPELKDLLGKPIDLGSDLDTALKLSKSIQTVQTKEDALSVLLDIWKMLDATQRRSVFYKDYPDLHDFLAGCTPEQIEILRGFPNPVTHPELYYARNWRILPAIEAFGIPRFKDRLNTAAGEFAKGKVRDVLVSETKDLAQLAGEKVITELGVNRKNIPAGEAPTKAYFTQLALKWAKGEIFKDQATTFGAEVPQAKLVVHSSTLAVEPAQAAVSQVFNVSGLAEGLSAQVTRWSGLEEAEGVSFESPEFFRSVLAQVNKLVGFGGYRDYQSKLISPYHFAFSGTDDFLDLKQLMVQAGLFAIPDQLVLKKGIDVDREQTRRLGLAFSASSQAEILRASAQAAQYFRDWVQNGFDKKLGRYKLGDLIQGVDPELSALALFPKERLFELSLGIGCVVLKDLTGSHSNLVLLYNDGRFVSGDQLDEIIKQAEKTPINGIPLSAALVDFTINGQSSEAKTESVTQFIFGIDEFLTALNDIDKSRSELLKDPKFMADIKDSRTKLSLLMMTMANFLSSQVQDQNGLFHSSYSLTQKTNSARISLKDQVAAIRALLVASRRLNAPVYQWSALDGYFALNRYFWNEKNGYYSDDEKPPSLSDHVAALLVLKSLESVVPPESLVQLQTVLKKELGPLVRQ